MAGELLDGEHVDAGLEQLREHGAPEVVRRDAAEPCLPLPVREDVVDRLATKPGGCSALSVVQLVRR